MARSEKLRDHQSYYNLSKLPEICTKFHGNLNIFQEIYSKLKYQTHGGGKGNVKGVTKVIRFHHVLIHPTDVGDNPKTQSNPDLNSDNPDLNLEFVILGIISET